MRTRNFLSAPGVAAVATGAAVTLSPSAAADTVDQLPPVPEAFSRSEVTEGVISPYGSTATCDSFHASYADCWQLRPDGHWQEMVRLDYANGGWTGDPLVIYPVWEDATAGSALSS